MPCWCRCGEGWRAAGPVWHWVLCLRESVVRVNACVCVCVFLSECEWCWRGTCKLQHKQRACCWWDTSHSGQGLTLFLIKYICTHVDLHLLIMMTSINQSVDGIIRSYQYTQYTDSTNSSSRISLLTFWDWCASAKSPSNLRSPAVTAWVRSCINTTLCLRVGFFLPLSYRWVDKAGTVCAPLSQPVVPVLMSTVSEKNRSLAPAWRDKQSVKSSSCCWHSSSFSWAQQC